MGLWTDGIEAVFFTRLKWYKILFYFDFIQSGGYDQDGKLEGVLTVREQVGLGADGGGRMDVKLILKTGKLAGKEIPVTLPVFRIGRAEDCHLRPHSEQVSRQHCQLIQEAGHVWVEDCGSRNGTWVNGQRITARKELKNGDRLLVGPLEFEVRIEIALGGKKKPKVKNIEEAAARVAQGASKKEDETELVEWLLEAEAEEEKETETFMAQSTQEASPTGSKARPTAAPEPPKEAPKIPGKFSPPPNVAPDSRTAAAEMLRRLLQRK